MSDESRMGIEGRTYWGTAGSQASTLLAIEKDSSYKIEPQKADTSDKSSNVDTEDVASVKISLELEVNMKDSDAFIAAARTAALTGGAIALRTVDKVASGWGVDADFTISVEEGRSRGDRQTFKVTATPTKKAGRAPTWG